VESVGHTSQRLRRLRAAPVPPRLVSRWLSASSPPTPSPRTPVSRRASACASPKAPRPPGWLSTVRKRPSAPSVGPWLYQPKLHEYRPAGCPTGRSHTLPPDCVMYSWFCDFAKYMGPLPPCVRVYPTCPPTHAVSWARPPCPRSRVAMCKKFHFWLIWFSNTSVSWALLGFPSKPGVVRGRQKSPWEQLCLAERCGCGWRVWGELGMGFYG